MLIWKGVLLSAIYLFVNFCFEMYMLVMCVLCFCFMQIIHLVRWKTLASFFNCDVKPKRFKFMSLWLGPKSTTFGGVGTITELWKQPCGTKTQSWKTIFKHKFKFFRAMPPIPLFEPLAMFIKANIIKLSIK